MDVMQRIPRHLSTFILLIVVSLPAALFVIASYVVACHAQQVLLTTSFPARRR